MTMATPSFSQIKAQVASIRRKLPQASVIGIHSAGRWTGDREKRDGDEAYSIHQCDSPLAIRQALREPVKDSTTIVLITPLDDADLSEDILLRLTKRRLFQIDSWQIVRSLFQAHAVDPRLTRHPWMPMVTRSRGVGTWMPTRFGQSYCDRLWVTRLKHPI